MSWLAGLVPYTVLFGCFVTRAYFSVARDRTEKRVSDDAVTCQNIPGSPSACGQRLITKSVRVYCGCFPSICMGLLFVMLRGPPLPEKAYEIWRDF